MYWSDCVKLLCLYIDAGLIALFAGLLWVKPTALAKASSNGAGSTAPDTSDIPILPEIDVRSRPLCRFA